jgi:hypothetical protein
MLRPSALLRFSAPRLDTAIGARPPSGPSTGTAGYAYRSALKHLLCGLRANVAAPVPGPGDGRSPLKPILAGFDPWNIFAFVGALNVSTKGHSYADDGSFQRNTKS